MINEFKLPTRHIQSLLSNTSTKNININATWNHFMIDRIPPMAHNRTQYSLVQQSHSHNNWVVEQSLTSEWPATGPVTCVTTCVLHVQSSSDHHQGSAVCLSWSVNMIDVNGNNNQNKQGYHNNRKRVFGWKLKFNNKDRSLVSSEKIQSLHFSKNLSFSHESIFNLEDELQIEVSLYNDGNNTLHIVLTI